MTLLAQLVQHVLTTLQGHLQRNISAAPQIWHHAPPKRLIVSDNMLDTPHWLVQYQIIAQLRAEHALGMEMDIGAWWTRFLTFSVRQLPITTMYLDASCKPCTLPESLFQSIPSKHLNVDSEISTIE
jgi:hypothetical protein